MSTLGPITIDTEARDALVRFLTEDLRDRENDPERSLEHMHDDAIMARAFRAVLAAVDYSEGRPDDPEANPRSVTEDGDALVDGLVRAADLAEHYRARAAELVAKLEHTRKLALRVVACDLESTEAAINDLSALFTEDEIFAAAEVLAAESEPPTEPLPVFPDIGCTHDPGECGFIAAGLGYQCLEGSACRRYVHPGEPHFDEIRDYDRKMTDLSRKDRTR